MNTIQISIPEIFYLFGTFHGVFMAMILLLSKKSHRGTVYLALLILLFSFYLFENVLYSSGYLRYVPQFLLTTLPLTFLIGPLFYFYVLKSSSIHFLLKPVHAIHLLPFVIEVILLLPFYRLSSEMKVSIYETSLASTTEWQFSAWFAGYLIYVFSACGYFIASFRRASRLIIRDSQNHRLPWLRQASLALLIYVLLGLLLSLYMFVDGSAKDVLYHSNLLLQTLLIQLVGYTAFVKPKVFQIPEANGKKYKFSSLDKSSMEDYRTRLTQLMDTEKPYLDPDISADHFVRRLGISKHHFSQLLTESMGTSFYDFINTYRVEKAKQLLTQDAYREAKVIHIAYDSGFSHKSTFLRSFKKITGHTPSEFRKKTKKEVALH